MDSLIGTTLGQYQIIEEIGRGGMAVVYKARQPSLNRFVALKVPLPQLTHDQAFVARFKREARIAAGLQNPHVLRIYEVSDALPYYIAMEYVEGESLADLLRRGALEPARAASILQQIADALDYAHARGIAHRDVKPSNIMIDRSGNAFLTDFGIARAAEGTRLTQTGAALGTPEYMSPEQCEGKSTDARSDIYSLGIVTYEMVTGRVPFHADTPLVTLYQQVHYLPPAIRRLNSHISLAVERVVLKALAKAPGQRYASAGEFARDFAMPPRVAEPRTVPAKAVRPQQTAVAQVLAMIAAVIVPLGVGGVLWASSQTAALMAKNLPAATNMPPSPTFTPRVISPTFTPTTTATPIVPACPDAPAIPAFAASPSTLGLGDSATLNWSGITNADSISIDNGIGSVGSSGSRTINPGNTTTYRLTATGCGGTTSKQVTVIVNTCLGPPSVSSFTTSPSTITAGSSTTLSWGNVTLADSITIDNGIGGVAAPGNRAVSPTATTTYTIVARGCGGTITKQTTVTVLPTPTITATPTPVVTKVSVSAKIEWVDTKVFIRRGQNVQITATGSWSHGMEGDTMPYYGAGGYPKIDSNALVPGSNVGMLVGKIGSGPAFAIGASKTLVADNEGTLFLAMNDVPGYFGDNDGTVQGNITVR